MRELGPQDGTLVVKTFREGVAAKVGHDLVIEVTRWRASVSGEAVEASVDARSLEVREGLNGVKPLSDRDRREIVKNIDEKVLQGRPIEFRSTSVDGPAITGELTIGSVTRPLSFQLAVAGDRMRGAVTIVQTDWDIKPYRGLMGALKVRDAVEVHVDVPADPLEA